MKLIADQESAWAILLLMKYFMKKNPNAKKRDVAVKNRIQVSLLAKKSTLCHNTSAGKRLFCFEVKKCLFEKKKVWPKIML